MRGPIAIVVIGTAAVIGGCVNTSSVSDALTGGTLAQRKTAVVVMRAQLLGHSCAGGTITIGKKLSADVYSTVATLQTTAHSGASSNDIMQVELPPDEYHVINVGCSVQSGRTFTTVSLGQKENANALGFGGAYKRTFATFNVKAGEIVNIGALTVMSAGNGGAHLSVADLPAASLMRFRAEKPNLAAQLTTRLMVIHRPQQPSAERQKMCAQLQDLAAAVPNLAHHVPPDCPPRRAAQVE